MAAAAIVKFENANLGPNDPHRANDHLHTNF